MDIFQRYEESLTAYNRAAGLIDRGSLNEAEPLLRDALALYPRQALMDDSAGADAEIRKTLDTLFENIRSKLIEIDRSRAAQRSVIGEGFGTLQNIVDRNVFIRRPAVEETFETSIETAPAETVYESVAPPVAPSVRDQLKHKIEGYISAARPAEEPPPKPPDEPVWESITPIGDSAPMEPDLPEPAAQPESPPHEWEMAEIAPEPAEEPLPAPVEPPKPFRPAAPPAERSAAKDEVEALLRSVDSIRDTDEIISEDDYRISDEVFLEGPIDEDGDEEEDIIEPLQEHVEEQFPEEGKDTTYTWSEEEEEIILKTSEKDLSGASSGGLMGKIRAFFTRKGSRGGPAKPKSRRKRAPEPDEDTPIAADETPPEIETMPDMPDIETSETVAVQEEGELKGTAMANHMESPEYETEETAVGAPESGGGEEVLSEEEASEGGELTPAEELLLEASRKEAEVKKTEKKRFLPSAKTIFSVKIGGHSSAGKKGKKRSRKKRKTGLFSFSISSTTLIIILLLAGAALAVYSTYPVYNEIAMQTRIDGAFERGDVDAGAAGYVRLAADTKNPRTLEWITSSAAARARAMIDSGEAAKAVGMLRLVLDQAAADERLRVLLVDAYATKGIADAEAGNMGAAKNLTAALEVEIKLIHGEMPAAVSAKYSRLRHLIK